jgi:hypothetical protein
MQIWVQINFIYGVIAAANNLCLLLHGISPYNPACLYLHDMASVPLSGSTIR